MVADNHYDDDALLRLLRNRMGDTQETALAHVETCDTCQSKLETISQSGMSWDEMSELLRPNDLFPVKEHHLLPDGGDSEPKDSIESAVSFLEPSNHPESLGRFARYEIMEVLGRGGMGIVMRGFDTSLNRHSAIKVLAPELATSAAARKRFSREAKSAAAVVHPHVVPIQTVDEYGGLPYLVMPVVEGQSVDGRVRDSGPLAVIETVRIAAQVAEGLAAAHDQGLVHRDVKPANVLLENGVERVQITDFGLARAIDDASMTRSGVIAGTPQYMSPEQAHGDAIDHRSDLFSLGSLIYFMLTGRSPFRAETTMGVLNRIGNDQPRSLRSINPGVPDWLEGIVLRLLAKEPNDRFQTAEELAELLNRWLAHLQTPDVVAAPKSNLAPSPTSQMTEPKRFRFGRIPAWLIAIASGALFVLLGVILVIETGKGTLRIETSSDVDVPIRITQGDETVETLTVSKSGATTRLKAGTYVLEIEDKSSIVEIQDNKVILKRGEEWIARIEATQGYSTTGMPENTPAAVAKNYFAILQRGAFSESNIDHILSSNHVGRLTERKWLELAAILIQDVLSHTPEVTVNGNSALAVFKEMKLTPRLFDVGGSGCLIMQMTRERERWRVRDVDIWAPKHAKQQLAQTRSSSEGEASNVRPDESIEVGATNTIRIQLLSNSEIRIQGKSVNVSRLREELLSAIPNDGAYSVLIVTDRDTPYKSVKAIIDILKDLGDSFAGNVKFALRSESDQTADINQPAFSTPISVLSHVAASEKSNDWAAMLVVFDDDLIRGLLLENLETIIKEELSGPPSEWTHEQKELSDVISDHLAGQDSDNAIADFLAIVRLSESLTLNDGPAVRGLLGAHIYNQLQSPRTMMGQICNWLQVNKDVKLTPRVYRLFNTVGNQVTVMSEEGDYALLIERGQRGWLVSNLWSSDAQKGVDAILKDWPYGFPRIEGDEGTTVEDNTLSDTNGPLSPMIEEKSEWDNFLNRCPADGVAVIRAANSQLNELNQDGLDKIADELGTSVVPMNMDVIHPNYILVKDQNLLAIQMGPATEKTLRRFIQSASDYLTPQQASVQPRSVIHFDCYINENNEAHGTMTAAPVHLAGVVLAQHEDHVLLLGPSSIAGYIEKGYKCLATLQADSGELVSVPIDVVSSSNVRKANVDVLVESGLAVYEASAVPNVPAVRLASPNIELEVGSRVLSGLTKRPNRRSPSVLAGYAPRIHWMTQEVTEWRESSYGYHPDGFEMFDVTFDGDNIPTWATFTPEGQLLGLGALFDFNNHTASILVPDAIHATLRASIPHIDDPYLKTMIENQVDAEQ
ncbi:Serine/threonine-protein kinase PknB [Rubinisphaera italica]|uniref:non-specific serine/threonine protein kinase n=2 Tax=Rubinisphaera italica TaxID=2527969 RepID=A0A5C5XNL8_9PLAN|nr:Serine/threonine-protein kinase PknB [Rubinisphaera italica]